MKTTIAPHWEDILVANGYPDFHSLWEAQAEWVEEPNDRRGGWSGVGTLTLQLDNGETKTLYIKRQQNHVFKSLCHPFKGQPTFRREIDNIKRFKAAALPTLTPVYYGERRVNGNQQAILITEALTEYTSLQDFIDNNSASDIDSSLRHSIIDNVALVVRQLHQQGLRHGCLYPKHIFIKITDKTNIDVRFIDLEKARQWPLRFQRSVRDLCNLHRYSQWWTSPDDRQRFLTKYLGTETLNAYGKKLSRQINKRTARKLAKKRQ